MSWAGRDGAELEAKTGDSSNTTCALVPQKPKLLTPARQGKSFGFHSMSLLLTKNGLLAKSMRGLGVLK
jgi:hypothetical protein